MPQFRKDPITARWVIVNMTNPRGADSFEPEERVRSSKTCPFCPGNEAMTPPEIVSYGRKPAAKVAGWQVRVVPNKFPAVRIEEKPDKYAFGIYDKIGGFGAHEVILENPEHDKQLPDLTDEQAEMVFRAYRDRWLDLRKDKRFKYILIFKNYGLSAGASLEHPHSQLIALPIVPSRVFGELKGASKYYEYTDRCVFCDMLNQERAEKKLTILEKDNFVAFAPFVSRFPFETWIMPKYHEASFDALSDNQIRELAVLMKNTLARLRKALKDPAYNFMIHSIPMQATDSESYHWHIEIIPHLTQIAGFEWGTGFYVNPTPPELAAENLRQSVL